MKILITGKNGQLGRALIKEIPKVFKSKDVEILGVTRNEFNLLEPKACESFLKEYKPNWLINTAAYTNVEKAEKEPSLARDVNTIAPKLLAEMISNNGGKMLHLSTDFVFSGEKGKPYITEEIMKPKCVYGITKCEGEKAVRKYLNKDGYILRTSWLYGDVGKNFLLTMLKLQKQYAYRNKSIKVISDQVGCPTSVTSLSNVCWEIIKQNGGNIPKVLHWSDAGAASWYDFAIAIRNISYDQGLIKEKVEIEPIKASEYSSNVPRPYYSILDCSITEKILKLKAEHWQKTLSKIIANINNN